MIITMETEELEALLAEAYEAGWQGTKELGPETAKELAEKASIPKSKKYGWECTSEIESIRELEQVYRSYHDYTNYTFTVQGSSTDWGVPSEIVAEPDNNWVPGAAPNIPE